VGKGNNPVSSGTPGLAGHAGDPPCDGCTTLPLADGEVDQLIEFFQLLDRWDRESGLGDSQATADSAISSGSDALEPLGQLVTPG